MTPAFISFACLTEHDQGRRKLDAGLRLRALRRRHVHPPWARCHYRTEGSIVVTLDAGGAAVQFKPRPAALEQREVVREPRACQGAAAVKTKLLQVVAYPGRPDTSTPEQDGVGCGLSGRRKREVLRTGVPKPWNRSRSGFTRKIDIAANRPLVMSV
jgi:hypothetical protein